MSVEKTHKLPYTPEWLAQRINRYILKKNKTRQTFFTVDNRHVYILPSKAGWLFILSLLAILTGAINYNNSLGYLLCFFLSSMCFIAMIMTHKNIKNICIYSRPSPATFPGQSINYHFSVKPDDNISHIALQTENDIFSVHPDTMTEFTIRETAHSRGRQNPTSFKIFTEFPLGLFHAWTQVSIDNTVIIYPKPVKHDISETVFTEKNLRQRSIEGDDEFAGIRDFIKGDSPKSLAWKAIAKTNQLYTKEFESEAGDSLIFDFDQLTSIQNTEEKLSILCDLVLQANARQLNYGLKLPSTNISPGSSASHMHHCLTALALY